MAAPMRETSENAVHASPMAAALPVPAFRRAFIIATIAALFLTIIGALGTGSAPLLPRLAYWLVIMETGAALGSGTAFAVQSWGRLRRHRFAEGALVSLAIAVPQTIVVTAATLLVFDNGRPDGAATVIMFLVVLMVSAIMTAISYATNPSPVIVMMSAVADAVPASGVVAAPRLLTRLPLRLRYARLLALEAEDHYLRVHTDAGSELILLRLSDAVDETDGLDGGRCHRGWWVARAAIAATDRSDGRAELTLATGITVPVSRSYLPALRAAGWFD